MSNNEENRKNDTAQYFLLANEQKDKSDISY